MPLLQALLVFFHLLSNLVWIGSILCVGVLLNSGAYPVAQGRHALVLYWRLANPAFIASFGFGLLRLSLNTEYYFRLTHFMHGKLTLALVVIGIHHVLGARARQLASGERAEAKGVAALCWLLFAAAAGASYLGLVKPF